MQLSSYTYNVAYVGDTYLEKTAAVVYKNNN